MILGLSLEQVTERQVRAISETGGLSGIRDHGALESAVAQPTMTAFGADLYPSLTEKAIALAFSLIKNHAFIDGNKRVAFYCLEDILALNGYEIRAGDMVKASIILEVAAGERTRESFEEWVEINLYPIED